MTLRIYNTLTGKKEEFVPLREKRVGLYVCGVTVYDLSHIGHARSTIVFDTIYRYLRYRGYDVTYVRNFTDIDDKIIKRANDEGVDYKSITEKYIHEFNVDMGSLGLEKPTVEPRATEHIPEMIRLISTLVEKGYAYPSEGDVFFSVENFKTTENCRRGTSTRCRRAPVLRSMRRRGTLSTLPSGRRASPESPGGKAPGEREGRAGTSSAP